MPEYAKLEAVRQEFLDRAFRVVWCSVSTVDTKGRPRARILHPYWEPDLTGWIGTWRDSPKAKHLAGNPYVSVAYIAEVFKPCYAECIAEWDDSPETKQRVHDLFKNAPAPMGYDTTQVFGPVDNPRFGILKLKPYQLEVSTFPGPHVVWRADRGE